MTAFRDSLTAKVREWFEANRDEELTFRDAAIKFGVNVPTIRTIIKRLRQQGIVESIHVLRHKEKGRMS